MRFIFYVLILLMMSLTMIGQGKISKDTVSQDKGQNPGNIFNLGSHAPEQTQADEPADLFNDSTTESGYREEILGYSVMGREIKARVYGNGPEPVLIVGAIHGDEPESGELVEKYWEHLDNHPEMYDGLTLWIVKYLNPDGVQLGTRQNANGIDLNRNFPASNFSIAERGRYYGGSRPLSEPESLCLYVLMITVRPSRILMIHTPLNKINWDGPADELAYLMHEASGLPLAPDIGYPTPGSFGSWAGIDRGYPVITLELPSGNISGDSLLDKLILTLDVFTANQPSRMFISEQYGVESAYLSAFLIWQPGLRMPADVGIEGYQPVDNLRADIFFWGGSDGIFPVPDPASVENWRIEVLRSENTAFIFGDDRLFFVFYVSTGETPSWTPIGEFRITSRMQNSLDPASGGVNRRILKRDLGNFWLGINYYHPRTRRQYGLHGTDEPESIGDNSSRGCVRFLNSDISVFYNLVTVGTPVIIRDTF